MIALQEDGGMVLQTGRSKSDVGSREVGKLVGRVRPRLDKPSNKIPPSLDQRDRK